MDVIRLAKVVTFFYLENIRLKLFISRRTEIFIGFTYRPSLRHTHRLGPPNKFETSLKAKIITFKNYLWLRYLPLDIHIF